MSCSSCGTGGSTPGGCRNNGTCGTSGCNKLTVFDWLGNMELPDGQQAFDYVEVRFKNSRKEYFHNKENLPLKIGDVVATQSQNGHDIGIVTLTGELVRVQMKRKRVKINDDIPVIYRIASQNDVDKWVSAREKEEPMKVRAREIAIRLNLKMKISDIEFQGDASKATFYYTADERVDFRELIREYASEFKTRIEMRQIGLRQEAARLGGIGSCGRELCCSTWLTDFRSVTTGAARYQNLSLNPQKLAGQCGKLKCCLNYELDTYLDALSDFPKQNQKLYTEKGTALCQKVDIFKGLMWYCYEGEWMNWHTLTTDQVHEIVAKNKAKEKVASIEEYASELYVEETTSFENVVGQDSLTRFDQPKSRGRRKKKRRNNRNRDKSAAPQQQKKEQSANQNSRKPKSGNPKGNSGKNNKNTAAKSNKNSKPGNRSGKPRKPQSNNKPPKPESK
ncbi:PSP1 domain-containing protein [Nonlabens xiamenensis]|uniref:PSP1 domain-containing protein n=1 Tax=Nonlabens xiamenensis TaxID=2341043 RepID=UPI000F60E56D|nr:regulatory iron-sulfur-containing complex subunit RicT [Nonlabens xiamenensis]